MIDIDMKLKLNVLPFELAKKTWSVSFYITQPTGEFTPLPASAFPPEILLEHASELRDTKQLYTDFQCHDDGDITYEINPAANINFIRAYVFFIMYKERKDNIRLVFPNFINDTNLWIRDVKPENGLYKYFKFTIRIQNSHNTLEALISFNGFSRVTEQPVTSLPLRNTDSISKVIYNGKIYNFQEHQEFKHNLSATYPILNLKLENDLNIPHDWNKTTENKYPKYYRYINNIKEKLIEIFSGTLNFNNDFIELKDTDYTILPPSAYQLQFKDKDAKDVTNIDIVSGFKYTGPYAPSPINRLNIFFIYQNTPKGKQARDTFADLFTKGRSDIYPLSKSIKQLCSCSEADDILFTSMDTILEDIERTLPERLYIPEKEYMAIYLSTINKDSFDDPNYQTVYAKIKEIFIKQGIPVQGIYQDRIYVGNSLKYYMTNIHAALLAKIGGTPWILNSAHHRDLVFGVGAFYSQRKGKRYLGSAFSFNSNGILKGFSCIHENDPSQLKVKLKKAILEFIQSENTQPERIIIHFYKKMSRDEWMPIHRMMLSELGQSIPIIIASINKHTDNDILAFDTACQDLLPLAGTYIPVNKNTYLLYNNTKYNQASWDNKSSRKAYSYPLKIRLDSPNSDILEDKTIVHEILTQIAQFSRMYWKSVDPQSIPITIKYPSLMAEFLPYFTDENIPNPEFGCKRLWFL